MADDVMKGNAELDALRPELWSPRLYPTLIEMLPNKEVVARDYEGEIRALGDIINVSEFPQFDDAVEIAEDERADADSVTALNIQLEINKQVVKDYIITDRAKVQTIDQNDALGDLVIHSIMKKMEGDIRSATVPSAAAPDHQIAYDSGTTLALADILEAKELLDQADVPDDGTRCMVLDSPQWNDLFNISGFTSRDFIPAGSPLTSGSFATPLMGFRPKHTSLAANVSTLYHPAYLQVATQKAMSSKVFDLGGEGKRAVRVNSDVLYGVKQFGDTRVVTIS